MCVVLDRALLIKIIQTSQGDYLSQAFFFIDNWRLFERNVGMATEYAKQPLGVDLAQGAIDRPPIVFASQTKHVSVFVSFFVFHLLWFWCIVELPRIETQER